jgi:hypothetical protein
LNTSLNTLRHPKQVSKAESNYYYRFNFIADPLIAEIMKGFEVVNGFQLVCLREMKAYTLCAESVDEKVEWMNFIKDKITAHLESRRKNRPNPRSRTQSII